MNCRENWRENGATLNDSSRKNHVYQHEAIVRKEPFGWLLQVTPCTSRWTRNVDGELVHFWFNGQQFTDELINLHNQRHR